MSSGPRYQQRFEEIKARARAWLRPGTGAVVDVVDVAGSADGRSVVASVVICERLEGTPASRLARIDLETGAIDLLTSGPNSDRVPRWSPDDSQIAFLSDREQAGVYRLRLFDVGSAVERAAASTEGWVEYLHWSSDGRSILLGVAGRHADLAGAQGGYSFDTQRRSAPDWSPAIDGGASEGAWRTVWLYDVTSNTVSRVSPPGVNVWEAAWCGHDAVVAICSDGPGEETWYRANVRLIDLAGNASQVLYQPKDQLGGVSASACGGTISVIEAVCSDRTVVAGVLTLIDRRSRVVTAAPSLAADVVQAHWRAGDQLLFVAVRGPETLVGLLDVGEACVRQLWARRHLTLSGHPLPFIAPLGAEPDGCIFVREGFFDAPTLVALQGQVEREIVCFGDAAPLTVAGSASSVSWVAEEGLEIHGWLLAPEGDGPHPFVLDVHGGPVAFSRPRFLARTFPHHALLAAGYAILQPNPRGSSGRGQDFARRVVGDMGGADARDLLSGVNAMIERLIADPDRLGVMGGSYGGFMTYWLIAQDNRFAAAVAVAPISNWVSAHLTSHISSFCRLFLAQGLHNPTGAYFHRSPIHHATRAQTPTLSVCGALDKNTPPTQALEFHNALRANSVASVLLTYPLEGHGIRKMPASFDFAARVVDWFDQHMPRRLD